MRPQVWKFLAHAFWEEQWLRNCLLFNSEWFCILVFTESIKRMLYSKYLYHCKTKNPLLLKNGNYHLKIQGSHKPSIFKKHNVCKAQWSKVPILQLIQVWLYYSLLEQETYHWYLTHTRIFINVSWMNEWTC